MATSNQEIHLVEKLNQLASRLSSKDDAGARKEALQLSKRLTASLEKPEDAVIPVTVKIAIQLDLFKHIANYGAPISSAELAALSGGEELLIIRVLRSVSSIGFVDEAGERLWQPNVITKAMTIDGIAAGYRMFGETIAGAALKAPKYLREKGYQCPTDPKDGLMQYAFQTKLSTFEYFNSIPEVIADFNAFMGNTMGARSFWIDWFPVKERLLDGATANSTLIVDVGGGARAYFYHHIFHDWSDVKCTEILTHVRAAMKPGYSRLLIHDMIIPEQGASTFHAMLDMAMMAFNSGMERTERQWRELLESVGFEVLKAWLPLEEDADGIIEAVLKE